MSVGVIGSGFGAYGYIPALIEEGNEVMALARILPKLSSRPELHRYIDEISFVDEFSELVRLSEKLVLAVPPTIQSELITSNDLSGKKVFLEKPLGVSFLEHSNALKTLIADKIDFRVAYLFLYTDWIKSIRGFHFDNLNILWNFPWPQSGWKSELLNSSGASVYYGIHFYPILWDLGISSKLVKTTEENGRLRIESLSPKVAITITNTNHKSFEVMSSLGGKRREIFKGKSPFGDTPKLDQLDPRIPFLREYLSDQSEISTTKRSLEIETYVEECRFTNPGNPVQN